MVAIKRIVQKIEQYAAGDHQGLVAVFAGATAGTGSATLRRTARMLRSSTFYIIGRNESQHYVLIDELKASAPSNKFVFVEAQVSLISDVDDAYKKVSSAEQRVDLLYISPGGMPFAGAKCQSCCSLYRAFRYPSSL